ncbi:MAG: GDP-mannose 4,6-dehydratase [Chloroflexi bacterium]|nr:GDP-mannose 4,6-dehydratase [Chloroflexota bacterium]
MRALITGVAGFAGSHLAEYLLSREKIEVFGIVRPGHASPNIEHLRPRLRLFEGDLASFDSVDAVVREIRPTHVFHLAAQAAVSYSWEHPGDTLSNNIISQLNVLEAVVRCSKEAKVLIVGSADEYGLVQPSELPIKETNPLRPNNPYAVSKIAQDMLGYQYFLSRQLPVVRLRPFNHIGPRQGEQFVTASFAKQIAEIELGLRKPVVLVGDLEVQRDFTDVRDIVRGYWLALLNGEPGEVYNIGSGKSLSVAHILQSLLAISNASIAVQQDSQRLRPSDVRVLVCDATKFHNQTGWKPRFSIEETLAELLDYWRDRLQRSKQTSVADPKGEDGSSGGVG